MSRNLVVPKDAERGRRQGGYTFNAFPPDDYNGLILVFACVRLGDHAHVETQSGRWRSSGPSRPNGICGLAGRMVLRWPEWIHLRHHLDEHTPYRIAEVEKPTRGQLDRYVTTAPPDVGEQVFPGP